MKKIIPTLMAIIITTQIFAQTENYTKAIENFTSNYNAENYTEIFNNFAPEMKQAIPLKEANEFLTNEKLTYGKIINTLFIEYVEGTFAIYKTTFEKEVRTIYLSLNTANKINGLAIKPYKEKIIIQKAANFLSTYPKEIAEIIFAKTKDFPNNTQLSIAIINNNKTSYYGIIKTNDTIKVIDNKSKVFEIGSLTKVFTSTVLATLVIDKKIKLNDNINTYYPFKFKDDIQLNFKSLANHTASLPRLPENFNPSNNANPYKDYGKKEIEDYLKNGIKLDTGKLKKYSYSNLGAGLLGHTLGLVQKTNFKKLLVTCIFNKYKMTNTFTSSQNLGNKLIKGLNSSGKKTSNWDFDVLFGGGGILSTTQDLAKFVIAHFNTKNAILNLTKTPTFKVNNTMQIGLGWHIIKLATGQELIWHNGGTGGYKSSTSINLKTKKAVIILSNLFGANTLDDLGYELIK